MVCGEKMLAMSDESAQDPPQSDPPAPPVRDFGPPPAGPLLCFYCVTATCWHRGCGGDIPALTMKDGTAACQDCASIVARRRADG